MIEHADGEVSPSDLRERLARGDQLAHEDMIEVLCSDQLKRWRAGERIPAEAYLALHPTLSSEGEGAFELVYGEYLVRELLGESPKLDEFLWRFPRFAERLRRQLSLHWALTDEDTTDETVSAVAAPAADQDALKAAPQLPGYQVLGELGRGGMSVVYLARQMTLNRIVALKVIRAKIYADTTIAARFRDEAEAAARLQHPNIIQVYEVGEFEGQGFLALEHAAGGSLAQKLEGTPQPARDAAQLVESLARALHSAHEHGIVHRDLKPANVVLTAEGVPKVTDFGLAKLMEREGGLTQTGDIMGTPSYMAPEQARGTPADVTRATDIYALGAILYEMLTGRPPFKGATPLSTLSQVAEQEPLAPGKLQRHTPRELETVCLKCLEKEPRKRYATALGLADDLRRFLENRPIRARRISLAGRALRWCRREPVKAGLVVALLCAFSAGVAGVTAEWRRAEDKARAESLARARAEREQGRAMDSVYFSRIAQARLEWRLNNVLGAQQLLDKCDPGRRGWEWYYLRNLSQSELLEVDSPELSFIFSVVFSPDGKRCAFAGYNPYQSGHERLTSVVEIWDATTQRRLRAFEGPTQTMRLSFRPDGLHLAASGTRETKIWDTSTGQLVRSWSPGGTVTYSPDGRFLAAGSDKQAIFWDAGTGAEVRRFSKSSGRITFSPDGLVWAVSGPDAVELHDVTSGRAIRALAHGPGEAEDRYRRFFPGEGPDLAFSPDGRMLVVATRTPRVWDTTTGQVLHQLGGHDGGVPGVAFSPDGRQVATAGVDSTVRVWDVESGAERAVLRGHAAWAGCVAFHPEGWCLLTGGRHIAQVKIWDLTRQQEYLSLPHASAPAFVFDAGGKHLKLATAEGRLETREIESGARTVGSLVDLSQQWLTPAAMAEFSADGLRLVAMSANRLLVKVCDPDSGNELTTLTGLTAPATYLAVSRDGGRVAAAGLFARNELRSREIKVWDAVSGQVLASFTPSPAATTFTHGKVALSPDGNRVAFDDYDRSTAAADSPAAVQSGQLKVLDVEGGRKLLSLPFGASILRCVTFSVDGKVLAAGNSDGEIFVWNAHTGESLYKEKQSGAFFRLAFSPDGRRLAGVDREKVQMWNAHDGQEVLLLRGAQARSVDGGFNPALAWSPDSRQLASLNWNGSVSVWNASAQPSTPAERTSQAESRVFAWHLTEGEAAAAHREARAASFHLSRLQEKEPPDVTSLARRARLCLVMGQWEQAGVDYARWSQTDEPDDRGSWLSYARLLLSRRDIKGIQQLRARVLDAFEKQPDRELAWVAAFAIGLAPGPPLPARVVRLVERELPVQNRRGHHEFALALARFRAEQWEPADGLLRHLLTAEPAWAPRCWPVLAMIEHRMGNVAESRRELDKASEWIDRHKPTASEVPAISIVTEEWLDCQSLCREAAALLRQAK